MTYPDDHAAERHAVWTRRLTPAMGSEAAAEATLVVKMERELDGLRQEATVYRCALEVLQAGGVIPDLLAACDAAVSVCTLSTQIRSARWPSLSEDEERAEADLALAMAALMGVGDG